MESAAAPPGGARGVFAPLGPCSTFTVTFTGLERDTNIADAAFCSTMSRSGASYTGGVATGSPAPIVKVPLIEALGQSMYKCRVGISSLSLRARS